MVCEKCGTKITKKAQYCPNCGTKVDKARKKKRMIFGIIAVIILLLSIVFFKYNALVLLSTLAIVCIAILINKKILNLRKKNKKEGSIEKHNFSDAEMKKFSEYFVSKEEKYISSLGNGYIMNFFANGSLKRGFAVISDKRVYFRGSCFSGQGKTLRKTDEERTVDIKDVTGSGFVYHRYIGTLLALFTAVITLLSGIAGSAAGAFYSWQKLQWKQQNANAIAEKLNDINDGKKEIQEIEEVIATNESEILNLNAELDELNALRTKAMTKSISPDDFLYDTEINAAYEDYLRDLQSIINNSYAGDCLDSLYDCAKKLKRDLAPSDADYNYISQHINNIINLYEAPEQMISGNSLNSYYNKLGSLYITPKGYCEIIYGSYETSKVVLAEAYGKAAYCKDCNYTDSDSYALYAMWTFGTQYINYNSVSEFENELKEPFAEAYQNFINTIAPDYAGQANPSLEEIVLNYLDEHPDASFCDAVNLADIHTEYDDDIQEITKKITELQTANEELAGEKSDTNSLMNRKDRFKSDYESANKESLIYFMITTVAGASVALLFTFLISCILTFADYLKKRKTLFEIQYAGGRIAFDVSYYAKVEIDDFQKQLRRAKDFAEDTSTIKTVTVDTPAQTSTQNSVPEDLRKYADLLKEGLISQEDYDAMKKKLLGL